MSLKCLGVSFAYLAAIAATAGYIGLAVFEILTAQNNSPQNTHLTGYGINSYAFCVTKAVINTIIGTFMVIAVTTGACIGAKGVTSGNSEMIDGGAIGSLIGAAIVFCVGSFISFDVNIWGLVVWFHFKDNTPDPYVEVFHAEMIVSFILVAMVGSICLLTCFSACCGLWTSDTSPKYGPYSLSNV